MVEKGVVNQVPAKDAPKAAAAPQPMRNTPQKNRKLYRNLRK